MSTEIYTYTDAATALGISYRSLQYLVKNGELTPERTGLTQSRGRYFSKAEIERYAAAHPRAKRAPTPAPQS